MVCDLKFTVYRYLEWYIRGFCRAVLPCLVYWKSSKSASLEMKLSALSLASGRDSLTAADTLRTYSRGVSFVASTAAAVVLEVLADDKLSLIHI